MAMAFESLGVPAISLNAFQVGIHTDSNFGDANITDIDTNRIEKELAENKIVIVTGFQGIDKDNNYTTLGRGGSDTTAVALAAALCADSCEIYTDVNGVFTADPRIVKNAIKLDTISYDEMLELSNHGAGVLHNKCVEIAKDNYIKLIVKSSMSNDEGTVITNCISYNPNPKITGVTSCNNTISLIGQNIDLSIMNKVTNALNKNHFKYNNLNYNNMEICLAIPGNEVNSCINCMHNLFF